MGYVRTDLGYLAGISMTQKIGDILKAHEKQAFLYAYSLAKNRDDAKDLVQTASVRVLCHFAKYDDSRFFWSWYSKIIKNIFLDLKKRPARIVDADYEGACSTFIDSNDDVHAKMEEKELRGVIFDVIDLLPQIYGEVLLDFYVDDKSYVQISKMQHISIGTVKSRMNRARALFIKALFKKGDLLK